MSEKTQPPINHQIGYDPRAPGLPDAHISDDDFLSIPFRLKIHDLCCPASERFLDTVNPCKALKAAVLLVFKVLYPRDYSVARPCRSITLVLHAFEGVAYNKGTGLDPLHREIHLSTSYLGQIPQERFKAEVLGLLTHEMVHSFQHDAQGTAPVGLTEGIADFVRLRTGLHPPHWKKKFDCNWDVGYEGTAFFLDFLDRRLGAGTTAKINLAMRVRKYNEEELFVLCCGHPVSVLWKAYKKTEQESKNSVV